MNIEQRKALEKILKSKVSLKREELRQKETQEKSELLKELEKRNRNKAKKLLQKKLELLKNIEKIEEDVKPLGFSFTYDNRLSPVLPQELVEKISKKYQEKWNKIANVENELSAKVWGVETDFEKLFEFVEKSLSKI